MLIKIKLLTIFFKNNFTSKEIRMYFQIRKKKGKDKSIQVDIDGLAFSTKYDGMIKKVLVISIKALQDKVMKLKVEIKLYNISLDSLEKFYILNY